MSARNYGGSTRRALIRPQNQCSHRRMYIKRRFPHFRKEPSRPYTTSVYDIHGGIDITDNSEPNLKEGFIQPRHSYISRVERRAYQANALSRVFHVPGNLFCPMPQ
ncbi:hypothetical protein PM082_000654 [Marasmius tenuissimus]|nr:hypothetical protein PM082_000654 [Marasmius tenuissimus]